MPDWLSALPIGLLFMLGTFLATRRRQYGKARARRELPALAKRWGWRVKPSSNPDAIGLLLGDFDGYQCLIDPDESGRIAVQFSTAPAVHLRNYEHFKRAPFGTEPVHTGDRKFDAFFKDRFASPDIATALESNANLGSYVAPFEPWKQQIVALSVSPGGLECSLEFGKPRYIPCKVVEALVPALTRIAKLLEHLESKEEGMDDKLEGSAQLTKRTPEQT